MWKWIKVGILLYLIFLGGSCTASKHISRHMAECAKELQLNERMREQQMRTKEEIEQEMKICLEGKIGFPENIFALWNPVNVEFTEK